MWYGNCAANECKAISGRCKVLGGGNESAQEKEDLSETQIGLIVRRGRRDAPFYEDAILRIYQGSSKFPSIHDVHDLTLADQVYLLLMTFLLRPFSFLYSVVLNFQPDSANGVPKERHMAYL